MVCISQSTSSTILEESQQAGSPTGLNKTFLASHTAYLHLITGLLNTSLELDLRSRDLEFQVSEQNEMKYENKKFIKT